MSEFNLCVQAHKRDIFHPKYLFITYSMDGKDWWIPNSTTDNITCTIVDYTELLQYSIQVLPFVDNANIENEEDIMVSPRSHKASLSTESLYKEQSDSVLLQ